MFAQLMDVVNLIALADELPSDFADRLGIQYSLDVGIEHKKKLGQFFTPTGIASFMAGLCKIAKRKISVLDPGTGTGILACAIIEQIISSSEQIYEIELTVFETDTQILGYTTLVLDYLSKWVQAKGSNILYYLCKNDFILHNSKILSHNSFEEKYDIVICNPPYFKIPSSDPRALVSKELINGQANIYSIFMIIAAKLLSVNGQLIFITPRSFTSGEYFRAFRKHFFFIVDIVYIHLFSSRRKIFKRDSVLLENIIVVARKKKVQTSSQLSLLQFVPDIQVSISDGIENLKSVQVKNYSIDNIVDLDSVNKILYTPSSEKEIEVIKTFKKWSGSFEKYGLKISTGPVVDFRNKVFISDTDGDKNVPLIYLHNIYKMNFMWPLHKRTKTTEKGQYIKDTEKTKRLVANRNYVLLRRFSSKDDSSRLIACPYLAERLYKYKKIGIENHVNYIYAIGREMSYFEVLGLCGLLNSDPFDTYFRTFNGNINVSATELRTLTLPPIEIILEIGEYLSKIIEPGQTIVDKIVKEKLNL